MRKDQSDLKFFTAKNKKQISLSPQRMKRNKKMCEIILPGSYL